MRWWPRRLVPILLYAALIGVVPLAGQEPGCPEAEFGNPALALDGLVFSLALESGQEAMQYAHDPESAAVLLRPVCPASRGDFSRLTFEMLPHIMLERQTVLNSEGRELGNYEIQKACLSFGFVMVLPPPPDDPSYEKRRQHLSALSRLCSPLPTLIVVSLPERAPGAPDLWYVYVQGYTVASTDVVRVSVHWEGVGSIPRVTASDHLSGWIT